MPSSNKFIPDSNSKMLLSHQLKPLRFVVAFVKQCRRKFFETLKSLRSVPKSVMRYLRELFEKPKSPRSMAKRDGVAWWNETRMNGKYLNI